MLNFKLLIIFVMMAGQARTSEDVENTNDSSSNNCTNKYCIPDEDYIDLIAESLEPDIYDWLLISMHIIVFVGGIIGNSLVCVAVYRNRSMRTVTNCYIVNLAIADLMVIIICLPPTVLWDVFETWFLGEKLCKIIPYLQTVSVSVSILTLAMISIDRWYAICLPLAFKSTPGRARKAICFIWLFSFLFDIPDLMVLHVVPPQHLKVKTIFYTQCLPSWSINSERGFTFLKLVFLYFGPLGFMTVAYRRIIHVLWRCDIPGYQLSRNKSPVPEANFSSENLDAQLLSRRKAAKMIVAVVLVFAICYTPLHLLTILRQSIGLPSNDFTVACSLLAHWLCYVNSAINPVIYNFMSEKFRTEFRRSFYCSRAVVSDDRGICKFVAISQPMEPQQAQCHSKLVQTTSDNFNCAHQSSELIPLGSLERASE